MWGAAPPQSCKRRCSPYLGSLPPSQSSPRDRAGLNPTAEMSRQVPVPGAGSLELGQRKAREKEQGAGQEEPDGTERGEALVSHTTHCCHHLKFPREHFFLHLCLPTVGWKQRVGCFGALLDFTTLMPSLCWNNKDCGKPALCSALQPKPELHT